MYCKECGKEIDDDSKFCRHCGRNLEKVNIKSNTKHKELDIDNTISKPKNKDLFKTEIKDNSIINSNIKARISLIIIGYILGFLGGVFGIWIGVHLAYSTVILKDGEKLMKYDKTTRIHGQSIFILSLISFIFFGTIVSTTNSLSQKENVYYGGFADPTTGLRDATGTLEEVAWTADYMFVQETDSLDNKTLKKIPKPITYENMKKMFEKKNIVTTMQDPIYNKIVYVALPINTYIEKDDIFSLKYGVQHMYSENKFSEWFKLFYNGIVIDIPIFFISKFGELANDTQYDNGWIFSQGQEAVDNYYTTLRKQLLEESNAVEVEALDKVYGSKDWMLLNDAFKRAEANIQDVSKAREISYYSQPETWANFDKKINAKINSYLNCRFKPSILVCEVSKKNNFEGKLFAAAPSLGKIFLIIGILSIIIFLKNTFKIKIVFFGKYFL